MNTIKVRGVSVGIPGKQKTYGREAVWPSIARQVEDAQAFNRARYSSQSHKSVQLYTMAEYCKHVDPGYLDKYEGVGDLEDEFLDRIGLGHKNPYKYEDGEVYHTWYSLKFKNLDRARSVIPLVGEFHRDMEEYEDNHSSGICINDPQDFACAYCDEDSLDYGEEVSDPGCDLHYVLTEEQERFWDGTTEEFQEYRRNKGAKS